MVVTTRQVRRTGVSGLLGGFDVEIAAATAPPPEPPPRHKGPFALGAYLPAPPRVPVIGAESPELAALRTELRGELRAMRVVLGRSTSPASAPNDLAAEIVAIRETLELLAPWSRKADKTAARLRAMGIEGAAAAHLSRAVHALARDTKNENDLLSTAISNTLNVAPWPLESSRRAVIAVVGPTGVGKTTTLAKLATRAKMDNRTVTLVTSDTFRVGGIEHIKRYASLLDMPTEIARTGSDLARILGRATTDLVLVDTSGRAPIASSAERLLASNAFKAAQENNGFTRQVLLCMSASSRAVDAMRIVKFFASAAPTAIAVTKIDETDTPSGLVHAGFFAKLPIAVLCSGQRVPEDIAPATIESILDVLCPRHETRKAMVA